MVSSTLSPTNLTVLTSGETGVEGVCDELSGSSGIEAMDGDVGHSSTPVSVSLSESLEDKLSKSSSEAKGEKGSNETSELESYSESQSISESEESSSSQSIEKKNFVSGILPYINR